MSINVNNRQSLVPDLIMREAAGQVVRYGNKKLAIDLLRGCDLSSEQITKIEQVFDAFIPDGFSGETKQLEGQMRDALKLEVPLKQVCIKVFERPAFSNHYLNNIDIIEKILPVCLSRGDARDVLALSCTNASISVGVEYLVNKVHSLIRICPGLTLLDAEAQGITASDEPPLDNFLVLKCFARCAHNVEKNAGMTVLTVFNDLTFRTQITEARSADIEIWSACREILEELGDVPVKKTYRVMLTNAPVTGTRNETYDNQKKRISEVGLDGLMKFEELLLLCRLTLKISKKCLYRQGTLGRTSTYVDGQLLALGHCSSNQIIIGSSSFGKGGEVTGAGGVKRL